MTVPYKIFSPCVEGNPLAEAGLIDQIVIQYNLLAKGKQTVIYVPSLEMAKAAYDKLHDADVCPSLYNNETPHRYGASIKLDFNVKARDVMITTIPIDDLKGVEAIIIAKTSSTKVAWGRKFKSMIRHSNEGVAIDLVGDVFKYGMPGETVLRPYQVKDMLDAAGVGGTQTGRFTMSVPTGAGKAGTDDTECN